MTSVPPLLATYGTLRQSLEGVERLGIADRVTFVEECQFAGILYDLGRFPGAAAGDGTVHGDLLHLRDPHVWSVLDRYEGYDPNRAADSLFVRRRVVLQVPAGQSAWVYWFNGDPTGRPQVSSGDWVAYVEGGAGFERN